MCELDTEYRPTFTVIARSGTSLGFACSENAECPLLMRFAFLFIFLCLEAKVYAQEEVPEKWRAAALSKVELPPAELVSMSKLSACFIGS